MSVLIIEDLVSRKWITHVVSAEETHTQVRLAFEQALDAEGLLETAVESGPTPWTARSVGTGRTS